MQEEAQVSSMRRIISYHKRVSEYWENGLGSVELFCTISDGVFLRHSRTAQRAAHLSGPAFFEGISNILFRLKIKRSRFFKRMQSPRWHDAFPSSNYIAKVNEGMHPINQKQKLDRVSENSF